MRQVIRWVLPAVLAANGLFMLLAPVAWYPLVPGVTETGPMNLHFIRDIGAAYLAAAAGLGWWAAEPRRGVVGAYAASVFLGLHMLIHVFDAFTTGHGLGDLVRDFVGVYLLALIPIWIVWRELTRKEA